MARKLSRIGMACVVPIPGRRRFARRAALRSPRARFKSRAPPNVIDNPFVASRAKAANRGRGAASRAAARTDHVSKSIRQHVESAAGRHLAAAGTRQSLAAADHSARRAVGHQVGRAFSAADDRARPRSLGPIAAGGEPAPTRSDATRQRTDPTFYARLTGSDQIIRFTPTPLDAARLG